MDLRLCTFERPTTIWSYVSAYRSAGGHMDLRFCMLERRVRGGRGKCGCGCSLAHMEGPAAVGRGGLPMYAELEPQQHFAQNSYKTQGKRSV